MSEAAIDVLKDIRTAGGSGGAGNISLASIDSKTPPLGQTTASASQPVVIASNQTAVPVTVSNQSIGAQAITNAVSVASANATTIALGSFNSTTGTINAEMITGIASSWYDAALYNSLSVVFYGTGSITGGIVTFEQTNDTTNDSAGVSMNLQSNSAANQLVQSNATTNSFVGAGTTRFVGPITTRYIRFRFTSAITSTGSVSGTLVLKQAPYTPLSIDIVQATAGSLNANINTVTTLSTITNAVNINAAVPSVVSDVALANITVSTTTSAFTPSAGCSQSFELYIPVVSGTNPTLDVDVQVSDDTGTNWYTVWSFPRATAATSMRSPLMPLTGNRVRYVQTVSGTTPSFNRTITRMQRADSVIPGSFQVIDRAVGMTAGSNTVSLETHGCKNIALVVDLAAGGAAPTFQLQGSDNNGVTWYAIGAATAATVGAAILISASNVAPTLVRGTVTVTGAGATLNSVTIKAY